jgi:putative ABC transport system substrate-binding protein
MMRGEGVGSRRRLLAALGIFCWTLASVACRPGAQPEAAPPIVDPPARAGASPILIAMPNSPNFTEARKSLVSEVRASFSVVTFVVTPSTTSKDLGAAIERTKPVCLVLMNNATMGLLSNYELAHPEETFPPTVLMMASLIEEVQGTLKNATGIAYEVPGVTALMNLRTVINAPINRVGVVYRPSLRKFVERQRGPAAREHIEIVPVALPADVTADELREALETLVKDRHVDALWMLNDNALVRDDQFRDGAWRAALNESRVPIVVGAANLINPGSPLGTLAAVPDHEALGLQAANLIFELADDNWRVARHPVELPLSVKTVVDLRRVRETFGLRLEALKHIDRALE